MKNKLTLLMLCALTATGCQKWIKPDSFSDKFRVGAAHGAYLGSVGTVSGTGIFGGHNQYTRDFMPKYHDLEITKDAGIEWSKTLFTDDSLKADVEANIAQKNLKIGADMDANIKYTNNLKAKLHILSFLSPLDAVEQLNELSKYRMDSVKDSGENARVISKVLVVLNYDESSKLEANGNLTISAIATPGAQVNAKGDFDLILKNSKNQTINLESGAIIGYAYNILCWKKEGDKLLITRAEYQKYGTDVDCPAESKNDPSDLK